MLEGQLNKGYTSRGLGNKFLSTKENFALVTKIGQLFEKVTFCKRICFTSGGASLKILSWFLNQFEPPESIFDTF